MDHHKTKPLCTTKESMIVVNRRPSSHLKFFCKLGNYELFFLYSYFLTKRLVCILVSWVSSQLAGLGVAVFVSRCDDHFQLLLKRLLAVTTRSRFRFSLDLVPRTRIVTLT